jgi:hypothetical protein
MNTDYRLKMLSKRKALEDDGLVFHTVTHVTRNSGAFWEEMNSSPRGMGLEYKGDYLFSVTPVLGTDTTQPLNRTTLHTRTFTRLNFSRILPELWEKDTSHFVAIPDGDVFKVYEIKRLSLNF